jgi:hypothetical protein
VKKWLVLRERLIEIAKTLRRFPWMVEVVRRRPMSILHPYMVEVYVARLGVGGVPLAHLVKGVLCPKRSREGRLS